MFTAVSIIYTSYAHGDRHVWDAPPEKRTTLVLCMWLGEFSFLVCGGCTKVSILLFYRRLVNGTYSKRYKWLIWFAIAFTIAYTFTFCIVLLLDCKPTRAYWMAFDIKFALTKDYSCLDNSNVMNAVAGVVPAIGDLYAVALPCIITWHHDVPRRQRIALNAIFCLGLVVVAASGIRTYWLMSKLSQNLHQFPIQPQLLIFIVLLSRGQRLKRRHALRLHGLRLGSVRAASWDHVCLCADFPCLFPPLSRRQSGVEWP